MYKKFINDIIQQRGQFGISDSEVFEQHHIIPRCIGGLGDYKDNTFRENSRHPNCIRLYPREHFIAHKLLAAENPKNPKIVWAWKAMWLSSGAERYEPTPEEFEECRLLLHQCGVTEETRQKMSAASSGENNGMFGKHHSTETKEKLSKANIGKTMYWWTDGTINTMAPQCPGPNFVRGRLKGFHDKKKRIVKKRGTYKKYVWLLPDGSTRIMDRLNATKHHKDWIKIKEAE